MTVPAVVAAIVPAPPKQRQVQQKALDKPKRRRISPKVIEAIELLSTGEARMQKDAARMVGLSAEHLCRQLNKDHVKDYLALAAKRKVSSAVYRAAHVKVELLDCDNSKVRNDVASDILAIGGIAPPRDGRGTSVSVHVQAGYIVDWRPDLEPPKPVIDAEIIEG